MKLALLGDDPRLVPLARAALEAGHEVARVREDAPLDSLLDAVVSRQPDDLQWEALLDAQEADAVLVGSSVDEPQRSEQIRKLIQAEIPLLVVHPVYPSMLLYFELDMIRAESRSILQHYAPGCRHSGLQQMREMLLADGESEIGTFEQVVFERQLSDRSKEKVLEQFTADAALLTALCGSLDKVGAQGAADTPAAYTNLNVQMSGPECTSVRWSVAQGNGGTLSVLGSHGKAVLRLFTDDRPPEFEILRGDQSRESPGTAADDAKAAIEHLAASLNHEDDGQDWAAACRTFDLSDAIERSLRRQRTITLLGEEHSETATFRGVMATVGCGLLVLGMFALLLTTLAAFLGTSIGIDVEFLRWMPPVLLGLLLAFLLLQLLPKLVIPAEREKLTRKTEDDL